MLGKMSESYVRIKRLLFYEFDFFDTVMKAISLLVLGLPNGFND